MFRDWDDVADYSAGTVIFEEQSPSDVIYVILSGEVKLSLRGSQIGVERDGGVIGVTALNKSASRSATASALTDVKLARLERKQFRKFVRENAEFSLHTMAVLANRLRAVDKYISEKIAVD